MPADRRSLASATGAAATTSAPATPGDAIPAARAPAGLSASLVATLSTLATLIDDSRDQWWLIGSAAAALHGAIHPPPADVDILMSAGDAAQLLGRLALLPAAGSPDSRFRSDTFVCWHGAPLPVEVMAGLRVRRGNRWVAVTPRTRMPIVLGAATMWVPARTELVDILHRFGRTKDLRRAAQLTDAGVDPVP